MQIDFGFLQIVCRLIFKIFIDLCVFFFVFFKFWNIATKFLKVVYIYILGDWRVHTYFPCNYNSRFAIDSTYTYDVSKFSKY